ncbi:hypothetical protein [Roseivirga sp.]|uniref:hypothetical protein n=1 Tax=Roseivirga sp. TaxID=1964215 RepID=UPI002B266618|nr:hypothetical protein [Roseivirga sp.]
MKYLFFFLLIILSHLSFAQDKAKVDFQKNILSVNTTLDGKKIIIKSIAWHKPGAGPNMRDYLVYDFESREVRFFSQAGPYGGFSPNANYFLNTKLIYAHNARGPYEVTLLNLNNNKEESWRDEHFGLAVYDDGKILATKAKTSKITTVIDSFSTLYLYSLEEGEGKQLLGKKEPLDNEYFYDNYSRDADPEFFQLLSPDNLSSWGGNLYNEDSGRSTAFNFYNLRDGSKKEVKLSFSDTTYLFRNTILTVNGESAMMRREMTRYKGQWQDYFIHASSGKKLAMSNNITHKTPVHYQMKDDNIYQFDNEDGVVMRFNTSTGLPVSDKLFFPKIPQTLLRGEEFEFTIASEKYLVAVPTSRTGEATDVIIYDLETNEVVDNFTIYKKDKLKEAVSTSSYSTKTLYKSDLLNSYDDLSLPYTLANPSGRSVTGLSGASSIGGGQVFAIGKIGATASKSLILLSLTRNTASNGSVASTYYVSVFDKDGNHKTSKEIGKVEQSSAGRVYAVVNFKIERGLNNTFTIIGEQQFEQRKTPFKITIEPSGNIH